MAHLEILHNICPVESLIFSDYKGKFPIPPKEGEGVDFKDEQIGDTSVDAQLLVKVGHHQRQLLSMLAKKHMLVQHNFLSLSGYLFYLFKIWLCCFEKQLSYDFHC